MIARMNIGQNNIRTYRQLKRKREMFNLLLIKSNKDKEIYPRHVVGSHQSAKPYLKLNLV